MASGSAIGRWVRRIGRRAHLVESEVAGDVVTRCGRRMAWNHERAGDLQYAPAMGARIVVPLWACTPCATRPSKDDKPT